MGGQNPWSNLEEKAASLLKLTGRPKSVSVQKKSQSGAVTELAVATESGSQNLNGGIRYKRISFARGCRITEKTAVQWTEKLLPSAYFEILKQDEEGVTLKGGGYGHGVGMSQTAANEMAKEGYTWRKS